MTVLRASAAICLAVVLALTSATMAVARGQQRPAGEAVLCLDGVSIAVPVDAQGKPTGPAHLCPDCVPAFAAAPPPPAPDAQGPAGWRLVRSVLPGATEPPARPGHRAAARGPPAPI